MKSATQNVLALLHAAAFAVFLAARAFLSSRKRAGLPCTDDIALRRASSSCFSITPAAGVTLLLCNAAPLPSEVEAARWRALLPHSLLLAVSIASSLGSISRHVFTPRPTLLPLLSAYLVGACEYQGEEISQFFVDQMRSFGATWGLRPKVVFLAPRLYHSDIYHPCISSLMAWLSDNQAKKG